MSLLTNSPSSNLSQTSKNLSNHSKTKRTNLIFESVLNATLIPDSPNPGCSKNDWTLKSPVFQRPTNIRDFVIRLHLRVFRKLHWAYLTKLYFTQGKVFTDLGSCLGFSCFCLWTYFMVLRPPRLTIAPTCLGSGQTALHFYCWGCWKPPLAELRRIWQSRSVSQHNRQQNGYRKRFLLFPKFFDFLTNC